MGGFKVRQVPGVVVDGGFRSEASVSLTAWLGTSGKAAELFLANSSNNNNKHTIHRTPYKRTPHTLPFHTSSRDNTAIHNYHI